MNLLLTLGILTLFAAPISCTIEAVHAKLYEGCYPDDPADRDLERLIWSKEDVNDIEACIIACRQHGYVYAGLQYGADCFCGNNLVRKANETDEDACDMPCPGNPLAVCGGEEANSIYNVPWDSRSMGCWQDDFMDPDLPVMLWTAAQSHSAVACIDACRECGYWYAGVQNGGSCYCGDQYGRHGEAEELLCKSVQCNGYTEQSCGGETANAMYLTELAQNLISVENPNTRRIYYNDPAFNGIETRLFVIFPDLRSIISPRISIHVTEDIDPILDDHIDCDTDCYEVCGEIYNIEGLDFTGENLTLRFFHLKLTDLPKYVGEDVRRLYVYAQTVVVDEDINVPYTLLIRTRNMVIDHTKARYITVSSSAPVLDIDMEEAQEKGVPSDLLFQKQSYMCSRILLDTKEPENVWKALAIAYDIAMDHTYSEEQEDWANAMRMYRAEILGLERYDINFIPFYTKSYLSDVLGILFDDLLVYKNEYDAMIDKNTANEDFVKAVTSMVEINQNTNIYQAEREYAAAVSGVERSKETYEKMYEQYTITKMRMEDAQTVFLENLEEYQSQSVARATMDFVKGMANMVVGAVMYSYGLVERGMNRVMDGINGMADSMKNLADTINKIERMVAASEKMIEYLEKIDEHYDYLIYMGDVEMSVQLQVMLTKWQILKENAYTVLVHSDIIFIKGCTDYRIHVLDLCNWGEALTRSLVDLSENLRECVRQRYVLLGKYEQQKRSEEYLAELEQDINNREAMTVAMAQQEYDIRLDLNEILLTFCQTYFYEDLRECSNALKPNFGGDLIQLLTKVNLARNDGIFLPGGGGPTVARYVYIRDTDLDPDCTDATLCPINVLRNSRTLYFPLDMGRFELDDLDKYRVREIVLDFVGAQSTTQNKLLKVSIMSSGVFQCRLQSTVYDFLSRALGLAYEYNIDTKYISIHADVYEPFRNIINHVTPYTTWVIQVSEDRSWDIDLSEVTEVRMRLDGTAVVQDFVELLPGY